MRIRAILGAAAIVALQAPVPAATYFVTTTGSDTCDGKSPATPFRRIQRGADAARPGDTVRVFAGTYRERVKPPRGGTDENARITYLANPGDRVVITGLDLWNPVWTVEGKLHKAIPDPALFTDTAYVDGGNPYTIKHSRIRGWCLGQVVVDGKEFVEQKTKADAVAAPGRWWADVETGTIYVNFGGSPATRSVEITTRRGVFRPYLHGLGYITVQGFTLEYCANQTMDGFYNAGNYKNHQSGLVGTRSGHHWIIRNNTIRKAKSSGLTVGMGGFFGEPYYNFVSGPTCFGFGPHVNIDNERPLQAEPDVRVVGHNLICNNAFDSCGQNGVVGYGHFGNVIYGNTFTNIPSLDSRRSAEDGAIKLHMCMGAVIESNLFEGYPHPAWVLWLDAAAIGTRIRRNVFNGRPEGNYTAIFVEITSARGYAANVIDNNLFLGCNSGIGGSRADGVGIHHNLFYRCRFAFSMGSERDDCGNTDRCGCGAVRIRAYHNLLIDNENNYGLAFHPKETEVETDYNILIPPGNKFQLVRKGTGNAAWCGGTEYTCAQIDERYAAAGKPGAFWDGGTTVWRIFGRSGPEGCIGDFAAWKAMMGSIDRHTVERTGDSCAAGSRSVMLDMGDDPGIGGPRLPGIGIDFNGRPIGDSPKAGPFQDLGTEPVTYATWDDARWPALPEPPRAPSKFAVTRSDGANRLSCKNHAADATHIVVERRKANGPWAVWGYVNTTQDTINDDKLTNASVYRYRIAARNAGGLSSYVLGAAPVPSQKR